MLAAEATPIYPLWSVTLVTNGILRMVLDREIPPQIRVYHNPFFWPYVVGLWVGGAQIKTGASALKWFVDLFKQGSRSARVDFETLLDEAAKIPPGSNGLAFLPYLIGRGSPVHPSILRPKAYLRV